MQHNRGEACIPPNVKEASKLYYTRRMPDLQEPMHAPMYPRSTLTCGMPRYYPRPQGTEYSSHITPTSRLRQFGQIDLYDSALSGNLAIRAFEHSHVGLYVVVNLLVVGHTRKRKSSRDIGLNRHPNLCSNSVSKKKQRREC